MKHIYKHGLKVIFLFSWLFAFQNTYAQSWQWVKGGGGNSNVEVAGISNQNVTTDLFGNVYGIAFDEIGLPLYTTIGLDTIQKGVFIVKHNTSTGNIIWVKKNLKNITEDCLSMVTDPIGNLYVTGQFYDTAVLDSYVLPSFGGTGYDIFLAKFDSSGNVLWAESAGGIGADNAKSIAIDSLGHIYITGGSTSPSIVFGNDTIQNNANNSYIAKYNGVTGSVIWVKSIVANPPILSSTQIRSCSITTDQSSNIFVTGDYSHSNSISVNSDTIISPGSVGFFLLKLDSSGSLKWIKTHRNFNYTHVQTDLTGNVFITGEFSISDTLNAIPLSLFGTKDIFVAKYDSMGNVLWAKNGGVPTISLVENGLIVDDSSGIYIITGYYGSDTSSHLHFGSSIFSVDNPSDPVYILKLDSSGRVLCNTSIRSGGDDYIGISIDNSNAIYVCGDYVDSCRFGTQLVSNSSTNENYFMAKILMPCGDNTVSVNNSSLSNIINIFPNPTNAILHIIGNNITSVIISNLLGQTVYSYEYNSQQVQLDVADLPKGIYFVKVNGGAVRKFVKE